MIIKLTANRTGRITIRRLRKEHLHFLVELTYLAVPSPAVGQNR